MLHPFVLFLTVVLGMLAALHIPGIIFFWYWKYWWLDLVTHFIGGFWIGGMALWFYFLSGNAISRQAINPYLFSMATAFFVGVAWEVFELLTGMTIASHEQYVPDTILDVVADITGAYVATIYFVKKYGVYVKS